MSLPKEVTDAFEAIAAYMGEDKAKVREVALAFRNDDPVKPIGSLIYNAGEAKKKGETTTKVTDLEAKVTELTEANEELTTQLDAANKKPNEQQTEWDRQKKKLEDAKVKAETELKAEREGRTTDRVGHIAGRVAGHLKGQVDDDYLSDVITGRIAKRVKPSENGTVQLLGDDDSPLEGEGEEAEKALAATMLKAVPDKYRLRNMQPGGGAAGSGSGTGDVTPQQLDEDKQGSGAYRM